MDRRKKDAMIFGGIMGYLFGAVILLAFMFFGMFYATKSLALGLIAVVVVFVSVLGLLYPHIREDAYYKKFFCVILIFGIIRAVIGDDYFQDIKDWGEAKIGDFLVKFDEVKPVSLKSGTVFYTQNSEGKIIYLRTLSDNLEAKVLAGYVKSDSGLKYKKVQLPIVRDGKYLQNVYGDESEILLVLPESLESKPPVSVPTQNTARNFEDIDHIVNRNNVKRFSFFYYMKDPPPINQRNYSSKFSRDVRFISWELLLEYPRSKRDFDFVLETVWYGPPNDAEIYRSVGDCKVEAGWNRSFYTDAFNPSGVWRKGKYHVKISYEDQVIASQSFTVF